MADGLVHCVEKGGWHPTVITNLIVETYYKSFMWYRAIGLISRVFDNGPEDRGSIPGRHTKDSKNDT